MWIKIGDRRGVSGLGARSLATEMRLGLDLRKCEWHRIRVAKSGQRINPWSAWIA